MIRTLRAVAALALVAALASLQPVGERTAAANHGGAQPNVLIILTDDQRADFMKVMKKTRKWFGYGGTNYPNTFATTPLCCPSRASIMTGQYAHNTNVETNADAERLDQRATMQRYLQDAGYRTAIVGKYLNGWNGNPPYFNDYAIFRHGDAGYHNTVVNVNGTFETVKRYSTDWVASRSVQTLRSFEANDRDPWMLMVTPFAPHAPYIPHKKFAKKKVPPYVNDPAMNETDRSDKPQWVQAKGPTYRTKASKIWTLQERMLLSADRLVDRILLALDQLGEAEPTLVFFLSDNGYTLGEHGLQQKHSPYTPSVQIPMMVRYPGHIGAGATDTRVVGNIDIAPTVYEAAGIEPDPEFPVDGRSLLDTSRARDRMLLEFVHREERAVPTWASLRTSTYQYVEYYDEDLQEIIFREYYDLTTDPYQLTNLLADSDTSNDPDPNTLTLMSVQLQRDRRCEGNEGSEACP